MVKVVLTIAINDLISVSLLSIDAVMLELIQGASYVKARIIQIARNE